MMSTTARIIHIPNQDIFQSHIASLKEQRKLNRSTRRVLDKIEKYFPHLIQDYGEHFSEVGSRLGLVPSLTRLLTTWAQHAGQHINIERLQYPEAPRYDRKLLEALIEREKITKTEKDPVVKQALVEVFSILENFIELTAELRLLRFHKERITSYCQGLYENFQFMQGELRDDLVHCQELEIQIVTLLKHHRILSPERATQSLRVNPQYRDRIGHHLEEDVESMDAIEHTSSYLRKARPKIQPSLAQKNKEDAKSKPSLLMRLWLFLKKIVLGILNFFRRIPPISWVFPLKAKDEQDSESEVSINDAKNKKVKINSPETQQGFSSAYRASRQHSSAVVSEPNIERVTPKTLKSRVR